MRVLTQADKLTTRVWHDLQQGHVGPEVLQMALTARALRGAQNHKVVTAVVEILINTGMGGT